MTVVRRPPGATYVKAEGADGHWGEFASTTLDDVWGRLEKFYQDRQGVDSTELDELAERFVNRTDLNTAARKITLADPVHLPWTDYEPGDTVTLNLAPKDVKRELRVAAITVSMGPSDAAPKYDVHFGAPVLSNEAAMAQGLRTLLREFRKPTATTTDGTPVTPVVALGGSAPTLVIAAANSSDSTKARADFICLGTSSTGGDHLVFQLAIQTLLGFGGGRLLVCEGDYYFSGTVHLASAAIGFGLRIEGMGAGATRLHMANGANVHMFQIDHDAGIPKFPIELASFAMDGNKANQTAGTPHGLLVNANGLSTLALTDMYVHDFRGSGFYSDRSSRIVFLDRCTFSANTSHGVATYWEGVFHITDCDVLSNGGRGIFCDHANQMVIKGCRVSSNTSYGIAGGGASQPDGQIIANNYITSNGNHGIYLNGHASAISGNYCQSNTGAGIAADGVGAVAAVVGNNCNLNTLEGILLGGAFGGVCAGNASQENGRHGISVFGDDWLITANRIDSNSRTTNNTYDGIIVTGDNCSILTNTIRVSLGGNAHRYGVNISGAGAATNWVAGNDSRGAVTANYVDTGTGTINIWAGTFGDNY